MSSLIEQYDAEQLGSSTENVNQGSTGTSSVAKSYIEWTNERKLKLALACYHHQGHLDTKDIKKTTKWETILSELWKFPPFIGQKVLKPDALKNTFNRFLHDDLKDLTSASVNLSGIICLTTMIAYVFANTSLKYTQELAPSLSIVNLWR